MEETMSEENESAVVTISEMKQEYDSNEDLLELIFGGNGDQCTYDGEYLPRQPVFVCVTCTPDGNAGICSACSLNCHSHHQVKELWTKRNFRCDCGNSKFCGSPKGSFVCKLKPKKDSINVQNSYNHNFKGLYCSCMRPYPDPEATEDENMFQCSICEDWFHEKHLGLMPSQSLPSDEEGENLFDELICSECASSKCSFLSHYPHLIMQPLIVSNDEMQSSIDASKSRAQVSDALNIDSADTTSIHSIQTENRSTEDDSNVSLEEEKINKKENDLNDLHLNQKNDCMKETKLIIDKTDDAINQSKNDIENRNDNENEIKAVHLKLDSESNGESSFKKETCLLRLAKESKEEEDEKDEEKMDSNFVPSHALFMTYEWRNKLCKCDDCMKMYDQLGLPFLFNPCDTIRNYEEKVEQRKKKDGPIANKIIDKNFEKLDHVQKLEFSHKYAEFKFDIGNYLSSISESGKIISKEDIDAFFSRKLKKRKLI